MDVKTLTGELPVTPQVEPTDPPAIAEAGFHPAICNRPGGEGPISPCSTRSSSRPRDWVCSQPRAAWFLEECILPPWYWRAMREGREWLARPQMAS